MPYRCFFAQAISSPQVTGSELAQALFLFELLTAIGLLLGLVVMLLKIVEFFRRKPTIESEFATKLELHREISGLRTQITDMDSRNTSQNEAIFDKIGTIATSFDTGMREMHRAIGRLEGEKTLATEIVNLLKR